MLLVVLLSVFTNESAQATVGGPIFINAFTYNPANESVYYIQRDGGGRGCPPELMKMSLVSGKSDVVFSCSQGEKIPGVSGKDVISLVNDEIDEIIKDFKPLTSINLKKHQILIDVNFINSEKYGPESTEILRSNFTSTVYQNNQKIADLSITGCLQEQPFVFAGYAIPGFEKKIILLLSAKGDCGEGGYTKEKLHIVSNINNLNRVHSTNNYKGASALVVDEGTLVVFESDRIENKVTDTPIQNTITTDVEVTSKGSTDTTPEDNSTLFVIIGIALLSVLAGLFIGKLLYKN